MMAVMYLPLSLDMMLIAPLLLIAAAFVQFWAGSVFYRAAWASARHGTTNMNTLVAVGTSLAFGYSAFVTLWPGLATEWGFPFFLRSFRVPDSPEEILHPPIAERVREYGYLAGIAVLAVVVGGAAFILANPAHQTPAPMPDHAGSAHAIVRPAAEYIPIYAAQPMSRAP